MSSSRKVRSSFPDMALPLITVTGDRETLEVNEEAAELLSQLDCAVCPIAVVGLYRSGKSSLLNFLNGRQSGFKVGPSVSRCTRGVWVYGKPVMRRLLDGSECAVVLLDTEGIGGLEADAHYDTRIFALSALLASSLVYNSLGSIDENAISQLSFVAQLSKHVRFKASTNDDEKTRRSIDRMEDEEDAARLSAFMPSFTWVLRDFSLELVDSRGEDITPDEYLEISLKPQKGYDSSVLERNRLRHMLVSFFPHRSCHALVRPVHDESSLQRIDELSSSDLRPEFKDGVEALRESLMDNMRPKKIGGAPMSGAAYVELVRQYVDAINSGGVPVVSSAWDHVSRVECGNASKDAFELFVDRLAKQRHAIKSLKRPIETDDLEAAVQQAKTSAFDSFNRRAVGDAAAEARTELEAKMKTEANDMASANLRVSASYCADLANKLYVDVVWASLTSITNNAGNEESTTESPADLAANLAAAWTEHKRKYTRKAKGPAKDSALLRFMAEKWPEAAHELVRRIEARHETEARLEHERVVKLKGELAEVEGSKEARAKMLEDAQQSLVQVQMEKARAEARNAVAKKQVDEARSKEKKTRAALERKLGDLELEIEKLRNQNAAAVAAADRAAALHSNSRPPRRDDDTRSPATADIADGKGGCKCVVS